MNVEEYIASGILEEYALGVVSPQEKQEVECMSHIYPEIKEALEEALGGVEHMAEHMAQTPPPELKSSILAAIEDVEQEVPPEAEKTEAEGDPDASKLISIQKANNTRFFISLAAMIIILFVAGAYFVIQLNYKEEQVAELEDANTQLSDNLQSLEGRIKELQFQNDDIQGSLAFIKDKTTEKVHLKGTSNQEDASVTIYWNRSTKDVFLSINHLETPPSDLQYQLWALVDGKPIDMGVFDLMGDEQMKLMTQVENAGAFAITLEQKGGSPTPNLDQLVVMGEV